jgi:predicted NACHT family NTPase
MCSPQLNGVSLNSGVLIDDMTSASGTRFAIAAFAFIFFLLFVDDTQAQGTAKLAIVAQIAHTELVDSVAFSPDGARVLSGSGDNTLKLWDAASGQLIRTFEGHTRGVSSIAFSPDGARVLSGGGDKTLKLWDTATGQLVRTFEGHTRGVSSVA